MKFGCKRTNSSEDTESLDAKEPKVQKIQKKWSYFDYVSPCSDLDFQDRTLNDFKFGTFIICFPSDVAADTAVKGLI